MSARIMARTRYKETGAGEVQIPKETLPSPSSTSSFGTFFSTVGARDTKFCRGIHRGITLTILSAQGGGLGPFLSPFIVLFCSLFPGGVRIFVKSTWQDRIALKFFFRLTPNSPFFRQLKRFTAQKRALQHSRVRNNMDLSFIVDDFWLQKVF